MGNSSDPTAVVDPELRVYGIAGLRVVDASIMPNVVSGNTNAPVVISKLFLVLFSRKFLLINIEYFQFL